jgi:hypothetical protein
MKLLISFLILAWASMPAYAQVKSLRAVDDLTS